MKFTHTLCSLLLVLPLTAAFPQESPYGLKFHAYSYKPELRTGLDLFPDDYASFPDGFSIRFDVKFEFKEIQTYGYIFRMTDKNKHKIDLVLGDKNISFSSSTGDIVFNQTFDEVRLQPERWMHIRLNVNIRKEELEISIGEVTRRWKIPEIQPFKDVRIVFGKNNYPETQAVDVPDMTLKDIRIENRKTTLYYWKLSKQAPGGVYDEVKNHWARCENPEWILTRNTLWKKEVTFSCGENPYIAYNPDQNRVAVADRRYFSLFSMNDKQLSRQAVRKGLSYPQFANQMIYNPVDSNYYVYNLVKEGDGREWAAFHPATGSWAPTTPHNHYSDYWHHNRYFSAKNNKLYLFGGYGHHKYQREAFLYDAANQVWSKQPLTGDSIEPRYLSGLGAINDRQLLRFGGYGSKSGNQELSPRHYYDAYAIDIETLEAKKVGTWKTPDENFVVSNSLVVDTANHCFYALCYPFTKFNTTIRLYKFSLTPPEYEILSDTIPLEFKDTGSFVDLFLDKTHRKLVAVTASAVGADSLTHISVYSLSYPPFRKSDLYQTAPPENSLPAPLLLSAAGLLLGASFVLFYKKRKKKTRTNRQPETLPEGDNDADNASGIATIKPLRKQAISLFGGFQVMDKDGNDLTAEFKPLIKNLFLLVLLNTIKNGKGISFLKMKETLWFDMSEESAHNNRGVAMSKIRQIMKQVGDVRFVKQGIYWSLECGNDIYCDYYEALVFIRKIKESREISLDDIHRLLAIVSEGELLPNMQTEWSDSFKSDFSNDLVDCLLYLINQKETRFSDALYIHMANAIFIHDPLNEDALRLKCAVLVKMGKNGLAKNTYTAFAKKYAAWFATDYTYSFEQIIGAYPGTPSG
ncbi:MAG: hypothetical protein LBC40_07100 [Dysgonamonadaceae bacterium]|nr:hypothetical protein [Dysgonamonadaceae bacterium]